MPDLQSLCGLETGRTMADYGRAAINTLAPITLLKKNGNKKGAVRGGLQGAAAGFIVGGPVGAAVGGAIGLTAGYFSDDPEEQLRQRKDELLAKINQERAKRMTEIERTSTNARLLQQQGSMVRALDSGRDPSDIEDSLLVANQNNIQDTNSAIRSSNEYFDEQSLNVEGEFASRPLEPSLTDTLFEAGGTAIQGHYLSEQAKRQQKYIDALTTNLATANTDISKAGGISGTPPVMQGTTGNFSASNPIQLNSQVQLDPNRPIADIKPNLLMQTKNYNRDYIYRQPGRNSANRSKTFRLQPFGG